MKLKSITGAIAAACLAIASPAAATTIKAPSPPAMERRIEKKKRQEMRTAYVASRLLRWRGVGMLSRGPRWPVAQPKRTVQTSGRAQDGTAYVVMSTGQLVRWPQKVHRTRPVRKMIKQFRREQSGRA